MSLYLPFLKKILTSGPLQELKFYQVNDNFFELEKKGVLLIDGGVQMKFPLGIISIAWNSDLELFELKNTAVSNIYRQNNLIEIETEYIKRQNKFVGLNVIDVRFKSHEFEYVADYTMKVEKEERVVELVLEFKYNYIMQIATVDYTLEENKSPDDFFYDVSCDLLISVNNIIDIKNVG